MNHADPRCNQATILESASVQGMCAKYLNGIETQLVGAFDDWAMHAEESARGLASFLDEVLTLDEPC